MDALHIAISRRRSLLNDVELKSALERRAGELLDASAIVEIVSGPATEERQDTNDVRFVFDDQTSQSGSRTGMLDFDAEFDQGGE